MHGKRRWKCFVGASEKRLQTRRKLFKRKWLDEIIIGAGKQKFNFPFGFIAGGEDKNRRRNAPLARRSADLKAIHRGKHEIENDKVVIRAVQ